MALAVAGQAPAYSTETKVINQAARPIATSFYWCQSMIPDAQKAVFRG
jgi:hypothetical protein